MTSRIRRKLHKEIRKGSEKFFSQFRYGDAETAGGMTKYRNGSDTFYISETFQNRTEDGESKDKKRRRRCIRNEPGEIRAAARERGAHLV
jgi:hypothetical protein